MKNKCVYDGCKNTIKIKKHGLCNPHYLKYRREQIKGKKSRTYWKLEIYKGNQK